MRTHRSVSTLIVLLVFTAPSAFARAPFPDVTAAAFENAILARHNELRAKHGGPPMVIDNSIVNYAKSRANLVSQKEGLSYGHAGLKGYGENLYWSASSESSIDVTQAARAAVDSWYNEIKNYNFNNPGFSGTTGHFTQVVWKGSIKLGCAVAHGKGGKWFETYVVCNYLEPGNMQGAFPQNVARPTR